MLGLRGKINLQYFRNGLIFVVLYQLLVVLTDELIVLNSTTDYAESLFFLPPGLSISFLVLFGPHYFPFLLVNPIFNAYANDRPWFIILFLPIILTTFYGGSTYILRNLLGYNPNEVSVSNTNKLTFIGTLTPLLVAMVINAVIIHFNELDWSVYWSRVPNWFIGDLIGIFTIVPIALGIYSIHISDDNFNLQNLVKKPQNIISFVLLNVITITIFAIFYEFNLNLIFALIIPVVFIAISYDPRITLFVGSYISLLFTILLSYFRPPLNILEIQLFIFFIVLTNLYFSAFRQENIEIQIKLDKEKIKNYEEKRYTTIGKLSQGISHDLNNVLTSAFLFLDKNELEGKNGLNQNDVNKLRSILDVNKNLLQRLNALSKFSVLNKNKLDVNNSILELQNTIENLVGSNIELDFQLQQPSGSIMGNISQIEQILLNLIVNSVDSIEDKGTITISSYCDLDRKNSLKGSKDQTDKSYSHLTYIQVTDSGKGIAKETQDKVFDMLFSTKPSNSGLGLWIVSEIIESMDGNIAIQSELNQGTSISAGFPCIGVNCQ